MIFKNNQSEKIKRLQNDNKELAKALARNIDKAVSLIEELEQDKLYYIKFDDGEEARLFKEDMDLVKKRMSWSIPNILILTKDLNELSDEELEKAKIFKERLTK